MSSLYRNSSGFVPGDVPAALRQKPMRRLPPTQVIETSSVPPKLPIGLSTDQLTPSLAEVNSEVLDKSPLITGIANSPVGYSGHTPPPGTTITLPFVGTP